MLDMPGVPERLASPPQFFMLALGKPALFERELFIRYCLLTVQMDPCSFDQMAQCGKPFAL